MTRTLKTFKGLFALLLSLAVVMTLGVSLFAYAASTVTEKVVVKQIITENTTPTRNSYTYVLTPEDTANPMPEGTRDDGKYYLPTITGSTTEATAPSFSIEIDASKPGVYQYRLEKVETTPEGDTISPESHIFGWQVTEDENGELVVKPYICQSNKPEFSDKSDSGYPTTITLVNAVTGEPDDNGNKGDKGDKGDPGQDGKDGQNGQDGKDGSDGKNGSNGTNGKNGTNGRNGTNGTNGTSGTTTKGSRVNTGDPYQIGLWIGLIVVSAGALIAIVVFRRKKDNEEDSD